MRGSLDAVLMPSVGCRVEPGQLRPLLRGCGRVLSPQGQVWLNLDGPALEAREVVHFCVREAGFIVKPQPHWGGDWSGGGRQA